MLELQNWLVTLYLTHKSRLMNIHKQHTVYLAREENENDLTIMSLVMHNKNGNTRLTL